MLVPSRKRAIFFRALLLIPIVAVFQNGGKLGTTSDVSGDMTTHVAVDVPQVKLEDMIRGYYVNIMGREPTAQELSQTLAAIRGGLSWDSLQTQLATSAETLTKLAQLLFQALGQNGNTSANLTYLTNLLNNGTTLEDIKKLLGLPATA